jgi:hypothetical protein
MNDVGMPLMQDSKEQWLEKFFRFGLVSKGVVYCVLGLLAMMTALGLSRERASKKEAFEFIYDQPFGQILLVIVVIGLAGFITLRVFQSLRDIDRHGKDARGVAARIGYGISALIYTSLAVYAVKLLLHSEKHGDSKQFVVTKVLNLPGGTWIIGIVSVIIIGSGIYQIYKGASQKFMEKVQLIGSRFSKLFTKAGIIGYISRGIVLLIIGYFFFHAAIDANPREVQDTEGAFSFLRKNFGSFLMGAVALGLIGYGIFMFVRAKYERFAVRLN